MGLFAACLLTVAIETLFFILAGYRDRVFVLVCVCANVATNLSLNLIALGLAALGMSLRFWIYPLELCVLAAEYFIYAALAGRSWKLLLWTFLANGLSYGTGLLIYGHA